MNDDIKQTNFNNTNEPLAQFNPIEELKRNHEAMLKEIRTWGYWSLGLGVLHIISSGLLDSAWGILLIIVGLASFYFRTAPIFVIYTITLAWAAFSNFISMNTEWMILAVFQIYIAFRTFKDFRRFQKIEAELINASIDGSSENLLSISQRTAKGFPWIGSLLGCSSVSICIVTLFLAFFIIDPTSVQNMVYPSYYALLTALMEVMGILGFSVSLASLISKYTPKLLTIAGLVIGGFLMFFIIIVRVAVL